MSQVLALKYRPSSFDKLIGQETITQTLTHALDQKRLSHAYLFSGLRGSGKTSTARIFAKALLCDSGPTATPCEVCENCTLANENRHIDIIEMDAASSRKIDDIRHLIEQTKYKPSMARYKIFIIDEVHMLTKEAFNALLKTLEEPPEYVKFILATTDPMKLPPTILSRTQHFRFKKIAQQEIVKHLAHILDLEQIEYEKEALSMLARSGSGSLRDTLTLLDQAILYTKRFVDAKSVSMMLGLLDPNMIEEIYRSILKRDTTKILEKIRELESYESEVVIDEMIAYLKAHFFETDARFSTLLSDRFFRLLAQSKSELYLNADSSFTLTLLFFKMIEATKIEEVDHQIEQLESKLKLSDQPMQETPHSTPVQTEPQPQVSQQTSSAPTTPSPEEPNHEEKIASRDEEHFKTLLQKLYDRNYALGECFENAIAFVAFEDQKLKVDSTASDECNQHLRQHYGIIKHFIEELYGIGVKLDVRKVAKVEENNEKKAEEEQTPTVEPRRTQEEDIGGGSSCVQSQVIGQTSSAEPNPETILEDPFIQKATELFEPSKVIIKSKV